MSRKNTVKYMVLSLIIFFGFLCIISDLCYAQYTTTAYPLYLNREYPGSFSMFGMYDSLYGMMTPFSMMNGLNGIYGLDGIYSSFIGLEMTTGLFGIYNILGGLGIMGGPDNIDSSYGGLGIIGGTAVKFSGLSGLDIIGGVNGTRSFSVTSGFGYLESPGLSGLGSLAGLGGLGSGAGLINSEATDITTYWGI